MAYGARLLLFHLQETLKNKVEDFMYSTAADRREAQHREEQCAELERVVTSADVVGTLHFGISTIERCSTQALVHQQPGLVTRAN